MKRIVVTAISAVRFFEVCSHSPCTALPPSARGDGQRRRSCTAASICPGGHLDMDLGKHPIPLARRCAKLSAMAGPQAGERGLASHSSHMAHAPQQLRKRLKGEDRLALRATRSWTRRRSAFYPISEAARAMASGAPRSHNAARQSRLPQPVRGVRLKTLRWRKIGAGLGRAHRRNPSNRLCRCVRQPRHTITRN